MLPTLAVQSSQVTPSGDGASPASTTAPCQTAIVGQATSLRCTCSTTTSPQRAVTDADQRTGASVPSQANGAASTAASSSTVTGPARCSDAAPPRSSVHTTEASTGGPCSAAATTTWPYVAAAAWGAVDSRTWTAGPPIRASATGSTGAIARTAPASSVPTRRRRSSARTAASCSPPNAGSATTQLAGAG